MSFLAMAVVAPLLLSVGSAPILAAEAVDPAAPPPPQAELLPGLDLYNDRDQLLGTIERVVTQNGEAIAIVTAGKNESRITGAMVAVPVKRIYVDGQKIKVPMSRGAFESRAVSEGDELREGGIAAAR